MRMATNVAVSGAAALIATTSAHAAYLGLGLRLHTTVNIGGIDRSVWRLYGVFDDPSNFLVLAGATDTIGPMVIQSRNVDDTAPGSTFYQNPAGGNTAPNQEAIDKIPNAQWDTFATIGVAVNDGTDQTFTTPGFPTFINGNSLSGVGLWGTGPLPQAQAGNGFNGTFINSGGSLNGLGVMIAQLTVNTGDNVRGTLLVSVNTTNGFPPSVTQPNQVFNSIPAPACIALLGMAGMIRRSRRR